MLVHVRFSELYSTQRKEDVQVHPHLSLNPLHELWTSWVCEAKSQENGHCWIPSQQRRNCSFSWRRLNMHSSEALRSPTDNGKKSPAWSCEMTEILPPLSLPIQCARLYLKLKIWQVHEKQNSSFLKITTSMNTCQPLIWKKYQDGKLSSSMPFLMKTPGLEFHTYVEKKPTYCYLSPLQPARFGKKNASAQQGPCNSSMPVLLHGP